MLGPHIRGSFRVTLLKRAINSRQSASCCALAREAIYASTLALVGLVLFSAMVRSVITGLAALGKPPDEHERDGGEEHDHNA